MIRLDSCDFSQLRKVFPPASHSFFNLNVDHTHCCPIGNDRNCKDSAPSFADAVRPGSERAIDQVLAYVEIFRPLRRDKVPGAAGDGKTDATSRRLSNEVEDAKNGVLQNSLQRRRRLLKYRSYS